MNENIKNSPLYRLKSINKLSLILNLDVLVLKNILKGVDEFNSIEKIKKYYKIFTLTQKKIIDINNNTNEFNYKIKVRLVSEAKNELKYIHKKVKIFLDRIQVPIYLKSGVKNESYITNAKYHLNSNFFMMLDIANYYPSITEDKIFDFMTSYFEQSKNVAKAITKVLTINKFNNDENIVLPQRSLATGSSASQLISFFVNQSMFNEIYKVSNNYNILFSLYVDDLTFSSTEKIPQKFINEIFTIINKRGYKIKKSKIEFGNKKNKKSNITGVKLGKNETFLPTIREEILQKSVNDFIKYLENISIDNLNIDEFISKKDKIYGLMNEAKEINNIHSGYYKKIENELEKIFFNNGNNLIDKKIEVFENFINNFTNCKNFQNFQKKYYINVIELTKIINLIKRLGNIDEKSHKNKINNLIANFSKKHFNNIQKCYHNSQVNNTYYRKLLKDLENKQIYN